jgi:hypothetical protein
MQVVDDLDFLQDLIDTPEPPRSTRGPRKKADTRDTETWWKLEHIISRCFSCNMVNCVEKGYEGTEESSFPSKCLECGSEDVSLTGHCSQGDECLGLALDIPKGPDRVTAIVQGIEMCRIDFLDGLAKAPE